MPMHDSDVNDLLPGHNPASRAKKESVRRDGACAGRSVGAVREEEEGTDVAVAFDEVVVVAVAVALR